MQRLWLCLVACLLGSATGIGAEEGITTVRPADNGAALANPGMGWVFHYYDNVPAHYGSKLAPSDTLDSWPGLSIGQLEQRAGQYVLPVTWTTHNALPANAK